MTAPELLECPWCNSKNIHRGIELGSGFYEKCTDCGARGPLSQDYEGSLHVWNTRVFPKWLREKIEEIKREHTHFNVVPRVLERVLSLTPEDK